MKFGEIKYSAFLKIVSFLFAVSFFLFSVYNFRKIFGVKYDIIIDGVPNDLIVTDDSDRVISVEYDCPFLVWGTSFTNRKHGTIKIDFSYRFFPMYTVDISDLDIPNFPLCRIKSAQPKVLTFGFERFISKRVKVLPDIVNNLSAGYIYAVEVNPPEVLLSGPESKVKDKEVVYTDFVVVQGDRVSPMVLEVPLFKFDKNIVISPDKVKVSVKIIKKE